MDDFHLFAGIAAEHAMKCILASENPAYLAPDRQFRSMKLICRGHGSWETLTEPVRTIGGVEAFERLVELDKSFRIYNDGVRQLLNFRNGEAHVGHHGATNSEEARKIFVSFIDGLLRSPSLQLGDGPKAFWVDELSHVESILDESRSAMQQIVDEKLVNAADEYDRKFGALGDKEASVVLSAIEAATESRADKDSVFVEECPACCSKGLLMGESNVEIDVSFDRDGNPEGGYYVQFRANEFRCDACSLALEDASEISAAGLDPEFVNDEANLEEYMTYYFDE